MYLQEIFEVVIGLIFTWLVLSTATMQVQEWIASVLRWRADDLEKTIERMLNDGDLTRLFYDHPLIRSLAGEQGHKNPKPSYIPSNKFSTVVLSIIQNAESETSLLLHSLYSLFSKLENIKSKVKRQHAQDELERLVELARLSVLTEGGEAMGNLMVTALEKEITNFGNQFPQIKEPAQAILEKAHRDKEQIDKLLKSLPHSQEKSSDFDKILRGMLALSVTDPKLRSTLSSLFIGIEDLAANSENYLQLLRTNIESWFNDSMDRLSGWYKRKAQLTAFVIGFIAAAVLNIDTIQLANQLWREPIVRQAINANANQILQQYGQTNAPATTDLILNLQDQFLSINLPVGWAFESENAISPQNCSFLPRPGSPFGLLWNGNCVRPVGTPVSTNGWIWSLTKIAGLFMTGLATTQGSSFWFDILVKIVNVRGSGIKPA